MINLLPPQYKKELSREEDWKLVVISGIFILIFLTSLILILFSVKIYVLGKLDSTEILVDLREKDFQAPELKGLREKVATVNQNLIKLNSFYQEETNFTTILEKISKTVPPEMYLTSFSVASQPKAVKKGLMKCSLSGYSPTRQALFGLKANLEKEKQISEIDFPPQNWIRPTDIDFYITFQYEPN